MILNSQKLIKSFGYILSSSAAVIMLGLVSTLLLAYYLSPENLGILFTAEAFVALFSLFFEFGFKNSIIQSSAQTKDNGLNIAIGNALLIKTIISLPLACLIYFSSRLMQFDSLTTYVLVAYIIIFTLDNYAKIFGVARRALGKFKLMAFITTLNPVLRVLSIICSFSFWTIDLMLLVNIFIGLSLIRLLISLFSTIFFIKIKMDTSKIQTMIKESFKYGLYDFLEDLQTRIDRVMISYFLGAASVAYYAIPAKITRLSQIIPQASSNVFLPSLQSHHESGSAEFKKISREHLRYTVMIAVIVSSIIYFLSEPFLTMLYSDKFAESFEVIRLFAFITFFWLVNSHFSLVFAAKSEHAPRLNWQFLATGINIVLNLALIPWLGIKGAVFASLAAVIIKTIGFTGFSAGHIDTNPIKTSAS